MLLALFYILVQLLLKEFNKHLAKNIIKNASSKKCL